MIISLKKKIKTLLQIWHPLQWTDMSTIYYYSFRNYRTLGSRQMENGRITYISKRELERGERKLYQPQSLIFNPTVSIRIIDNSSVIPKGITKSCYFEKNNKCKFRQTCISWYSIYDNAYETSNLSSRWQDPMDIFLKIDLQISEDLIIQTIATR
jgi:hypothetical protein